MKKNQKKNSLLIGMVISVLTFLLLFIGVKFILTNEITIQNYVAYIILSVIVGVLSGIFYYFNLRIPLITFIVGVLLGFFNMYTIFINDFDGWNDLIGFMTFFFWVIGGLAIGLFIQFILYIIKKWKTTKNE
jgi:hypothetical protein